MGGSGWARDPVVVVATGSLLVESLGWVVWAVATPGNLPAGVSVWEYVVLGGIVGTAAALAACAAGVLRGFRWFAVAAAWTVAVLTAFVGTLTVALINVPTIALLAWANARLRGAVRARGVVRDPVVLLAGGSCLVAALAITGWIGVWVWRSDILFPEFPEWFSPFFPIAVRVAPTVALAAAAVGMLRGSPGWALVAMGLIVTMGAAVTTFAEGVAAAVALPVTAVLLVTLGFACARLQKPADE